MTNVMCDQCGRNILRTSAGWVTLTERRNTAPRPFDFCNDRCMWEWVTQRVTPSRRLTHDDFNLAREVLAEARQTRVAEAWDERSVS